MRQPLTPRQQEVLNWIKDYQRQCRCSPTIREIMRGLGLSSPAPVQNALLRLQDKKYIDWQRGKNRSIVVLDEIPYSELRERAIAALEEALALSPQLPLASSLLQQLKQ